MDHWNFVVDLDLSRSFEHGVLLQVMFVVPAGVM